MTSTLGNLQTRFLQLISLVAGRAYVPSENLDGALLVAKRLASQNIPCTIGYYNNNYRAITSENMIDISCKMIAALADLDPKGYISVKAPDFDFDPDVLSMIAATAQKLGILVHFDSHDIRQADQEQACARQMQALGAAVSQSIPGCWLRSVADAEQAAQLGMRIRVVKGLWADPAAPDIDMRTAYLQIIDTIAGKAPEVAIATHDAWLARESILRLQAAGTACELELLYGLPSRAIYALAKEYSVPVRVYIPFGFAWQPYALEKFAKNPRILAWVARDFFAGLISLCSAPKSDKK